MLKGYRLHRELPEEHLAMLPTFLMLRGFAYLGWLQSRRDTVEAKELGPIVVPDICAMATAYLKDT